METTHTITNQVRCSVGQWVGHTLFGRELRLSTIATTNREGRFGGCICQVIDVKQDEQKRNLPLK